MPESFIFLSYFSHSFLKFLSSSVTVVLVICFRESKLAGAKANNSLSVLSIGLVSKLVSKWWLLCPPYSAPDRECITKVCNVHKNGYVWVIGTPMITTIKAVITINSCNISSNMSSNE